MFRQLENGQIAKTVITVLRAHTLDEYRYLPRESAIVCNDLIMPQK